MLNAKQKYITSVAILATMSICTVVGFILMLVGTWAIFWWSRIDIILLGAVLTLVNLLPFEWVIRDMRRWIRESPR